MSLQAILTSPNKHQIDYRLKFIESLLDKKCLDPLIEFDPELSENLVSHDYRRHNEDKDCHDIRCILNKKEHDFKKVITDIGGKLLYKKSGTTGHVFQGLTFSQKNAGLSYAVKIVAYPKKESYGNINDIRRPENAELLMLRALSYFVVNKHTPHIMLPIGTFNTSIEPFVQLTRGEEKSKIIKSDKYEKFVQRYKNGDFYDKVSVLIAEWAGGGDLLDYIKRNYMKMTEKEWKVIFFQVISVLAVIQAKYAGFRHNDLKANNILVQEYPNQKGQKTLMWKYDINDQTYEFANIGIQIRIWDFDFACIPNVVDNAKTSATWTDRINVKPEQNRYYDMHFFLNTLTKHGGFFKDISDKDNPKDFWTSNYVPKTVKEFVRRVVPEKYSIGRYVDDRGRILIKKEFTTPDKVLKNDEFFRELREHKKGKK